MIERVSTSASTLFVLLLLVRGDCARPVGPCDIFSDAGTPCVAAHSMVRAMYAAYKGPLYTLRRSSDNETMDIGLVGDTGFADASAQQSFCMNPPAECIVERIFDQSPRGNHLERVRVYRNNSHAWPVKGINAMRDELTVSGHAVYSAYFEGGQTNQPGMNSGTMGFRSNRLNGNASGVAVGDEPETIYMVTSGDHYNKGCCFDYGNSEVVGCGYPGVEPCGAQAGVRRIDDPNNPCIGCGKMEAIYWGAGSNGPSHSADASWHPGPGGGPWVMGDLESGVWGGSDPRLNPSNLPFNTSKFVTAMLKGKPGHWALKVGDAQQGKLKVSYDGPRPPNYEVMQKQGAIVLGIGGDNSDFGSGTFYEGALTANYSSDATDDALQANIVAAAYGK